MHPIYRMGVKFPSRFPILYLFNKYPYRIFQTCCIISIFFSSKCRLFHNATLFGFCITHILNTGCAKNWKKKSVAKRLKKKVSKHTVLKFYPGWLSRCIDYATLWSIQGSLFSRSHFSPTTSRPALRPTQLHIQWVPRDFPTTLPEHSSYGLKLTTLFRPVPRLRFLETVPLPAWHGQRWVPLSY